jgi:hypothetical protein
MYEHELFSSPVIIPCLVLLLALFGLVITEYQSARRVQGKTIFTIKRNGNYQAFQQTAVSLISASFNTAGEKQ